MTDKKRMVFCSNGPNTELTARFWELNRVEGYTSLKIGKTINAKNVISFVPRMMAMATAEMRLAA